MIAPGKFTIYFIHNENIVCLYIYVVLIAPFCLSINFVLVLIENKSNLT